MAAIRLGVILCLLILAACRYDRKPEFSPVASIDPPAGHLPLYGFGVRPALTTRHLWQRYTPLLDQVNRLVDGFHLRLESAQTEATYDTKLRQKRFDIAIVEPHRVFQAEELGYSVFARAGSKDRVSALIVVRRDSDIRRLVDLRGKTISFSSPGALSPTMLVRFHLARAAFDPMRGARSIYTGSQESALLQVYLKASSAAAVSKSTWDFFAAQRPSIASELDPKWQTINLPGSALMASARVPVRHLRQLQRVFSRLSETADGMSAMTTAGFSDIRPGESGTYDDLWEFINDYRRAFRTLPPFGDAR